MNKNLKRAFYYVAALLIWMFYNYQERTDDLWYKEENFLLISGLFVFLAFLGIRRSMKSN